MSPSSAASDVYKRQGVARARAATHNTKDAPANLASSPAVSCVHCASANIRKASHSGHLHTPPPALGCLHFDLKGPMSRSLGGAYYAAFWIDEHSRMVFTDALNSKDQCIYKTKLVMPKFAATVGVPTDDRGAPLPRPVVWAIRSVHER